jgi:formylmethanofuran dehydrogenase subunit E
MGGTAEFGASHVELSSNGARVSDMNLSNDLPDDLLEAVRFHGHLCPGLAIGYVAAKVGAQVLSIGASEDEEVVAVVENNSCAVDAIQVLLGCTFGKGNLIFNDWGKQVFTFIDRRMSRAVRVSFTGPVPERDERHALKAKLDAGTATDAERIKWEELRKSAVKRLVTADPREFFFIREVPAREPPRAEVVVTKPCGLCGEATVTTRMLEMEGSLVCRDCAAGTYETWGVF